MERLTKREMIELKNGQKIVSCNYEDDECNDHCMYGYCKWVKKALKKLKEYEDAEEQGFLLRTPCKIGETVWDIDMKIPCAYRITGFSFGTGEDYIDEPVTEKEIVFYYRSSSGSITGSFAISEIGKTIFLTKEEAEAALERMNENA